jgi:hypothetical protein
MTLRPSHLCAAVAAAAFLAGPGAAAADLLDPVDTLVDPCHESLSQPFLPWLDPAHYFLAPDGGFEAGARGWLRTGGARVAAGNEPHFVSGPGTRSLVLPRGGTAETPAFCASLLSPTVRFFARAEGTPSELAVQVVYRDVLGVERTAPVGVVTPLAGFQPTPPLPLLVNALAPLAADGALELRLRLVGVSGTVRIDDVYVDPFKVR